MRTDECSNRGPDRKIENKEFRRINRLNLGRNAIS